MILTQLSHEMLEPCFHRLALQAPVEARDMHFEDDRFADLEKDGRGNIGQKPLGKHFCIDGKEPILLSQRLRSSLQKGESALEKWAERR